MCFLHTRMLPAGATKMITILTTLNSIQMRWMPLIMTTDGKKQKNSKVTQHRSGRFSCIATANYGTVKRYSPDQSEFRKSQIALVSNRIPASRCNPTPPSLHSRGYHIYIHCYQQQLLQYKLGFRNIQWKREVPHNSAVKGEIILKLKQSVYTKQMFNFKHA